MNTFNQHNIMFMIICMFFAGYTSTMNNWIDNLDDFRFSINDFYMVGLMTGWMIFFMGLFTLRIMRCILGLFIAGTVFILIRKQVFVDEYEYLKGMIPHHSMAIMMSKRLHMKENSITQLLDQIIISQQHEIMIMKEHLKK